MAFIFAARTTITMCAASDLDTKLLSRTSSVTLEETMRKPLMALVNRFTEKQSKQRQKFKGYFLQQTYLQSSIAE